MTRLSTILMLTLAFHAALCEEPKPAAAAADATAKFDADFNKAKEAVGARKWKNAKAFLESALKNIGDNEHRDKALAQILLKKANEEVAEEEHLYVANELLRLQQWGEAEKAFEMAKATLGETEAVKAGIQAARDGAREEKERAAAAKPPPPQPAPTPAPAAPATPPATAQTAPEPAKPAPTPPPPPVATATAPTVESAPAPLEVPTPRPLVRDAWEKGAGSQCFWEGDRLHLEEGDEYMTKLFKGDLAVSVAIEAQMDHRSAISIELRAPKESGNKTRIIGWGSKEGSAPYLAVDKDVKARGKAQPAQEQITLSFVRTGQKIEFYCNGELIGSTWDAREKQPYHLWVGGKGIMNGARAVER